MKDTTIQKDSKLTSMAIIGTEEVTSLFNAVGVEVYNITEKNKEEIQDKIDSLIFKLSKDNFKIILISEKLYPLITATLTKYSSCAYPIIIPLPLDLVQSGIGLKKIKDSVEQAIGISIF